MRLFLGIEIPNSVKQHIHQSIFPAQKNPKGWENPHDYHLTLLFIGETQVEMVSSIISNMEQIKFKPFYITTNKLEFFNRRVLYLSFEYSDELMALKDQIEKVFKTFLRPQNKDFIPHLTIKRWQRYEFESLKNLVNLYPIPSQKIFVHQIVLFKSEKDVDNNKYHIIHRLELQQ